MKIIRVLLLVIFLIFVFTSCNTILSSRPSDSQTLTSVTSNEVLSPFTLYENLKRAEMGTNSEQADNILRSYGIYDKVLAKVSKEAYLDSAYSDVRISGFSIGAKQVAVFLINKGHLYIYVMLSKSNNGWVVNGFAYQNEREKPEYRVEQSSDQTRYWLVIRHEANHGTGLQIFDEIWYNPDGSVAGEYPAEGSTLLFPQSIEPEANTHFSVSVYYDNDSKIALSYSISFEYGYSINLKDDFYRFISKYRPVIRENWEYDLETQQLKFISSDPVLPENFNTMKHTVSAEYGILQGYIDFYRTKLGDKKITTLGGWEKFTGLK